jgi:hypothetical protein
MEDKIQEFQNPIDPEKIAENPGLLPYAHHAGSAMIKPEDTHKLTTRALKSMEHQTTAQLSQIYEQINLLAQQVKTIQRRKELSYFIYQCEVKFEPLIEHTYYLYRKDNSYRLSLIAPTDWGRSTNNLSYMATVKLLSDHTWDILSAADDWDQAFPSE